MEGDDLQFKVKFEYGDVKADIFVSADDEEEAERKARGFLRSPEMWTLLRVDYDDGA